MNDNIELINIFLTMKCNLACNFCASSSDSNRNEVIDDKLLDKLASDLNIYNSKHGKQSLPELRFTGGEPLTHPYLLDILDHFDFIPCKTITSNATLVNDKLLSELEKRNIRIIASVYIDSNGKIKNRKGLKCLLGSELDVYCTLVLQKSILPHLKNIYEQLNTWNAKYLFLNGINPSGQAASIFIDSRLGSDDVLKVERFINSHKNRQPELIFREPVTIKTGLDQEHANINCPSCHCGSGHISIGVDGDMYPCNSLIGFKVGNYNETEISAAYDSPQMRFIRSLQSLTHNDLTPCNTCIHTGNCNAGSRVHAYQRTGDWLAVDPAAPCFIKNRRLGWNNLKYQNLYNEAMENIIKTRANKISTGF